MNNRKSRYGNNYNQLNDSDKIETEKIFSRQYVKNTNKGPVTTSRNGRFDRIGHSTGDNSNRSYSYKPTQVTSSQISQTSPQSKIHYNNIHYVNTIPSNLQPIECEIFQNTHPTNLYPIINNSIPNNNLHSIPNNNLHSIPNNNLHSIPNNNLHSIPNNNLHSIPNNNLHSIPNNNLHSIPNNLYSVQNNNLYPASNNNSYLIPNPNNNAYIVPNSIQHSSTCPINAHSVKPLHVVDLPVKPLHVVDLPVKLPDVAKMCQNILCPNNLCQELSPDDIYQNNIPYRTGDDIDIYRDNEYYQNYIAELIDSISILEEEIYNMNIIMNNQTITLHDQEKLIEQMKNTSGKSTKSRESSGKITKSTEKKIRNTSRSYPVSNMHQSSIVSSDNEDDVEIII